jgi:hypothetical protein
MQLKRPTNMKLYETFWCNFLQSMLRRYINLQRIVDVSSFDSWNNIQLSVTRKEVYPNPFGHASHPQVIVQHSKSETQLHFICMHRDTMLRPFSVGAWRQKQITSPSTFCNIWHNTHQQKLLFLCLNWFDSRNLVSLFLHIQKKAASKAKAGKMGIPPA